jgi:predicted amidohydrolase YtcJ
VITRLLHNGVFHTLAGADAQAVALSGTRIAAVGASEPILALREAATKVTDLAGACVLPGFNDSHCHLLGTGELALNLDLRGARSREEIIARGRAFILSARLPPGRWIVGRGFDHRLFPDETLPDSRTADSISIAHPVLLLRVCGHIGAANSLALAAAGFDARASIPGGVLGRGADGRLNGIACERALDILRALVPPCGEEELADTMLAATRMANAAGITSVQSDDLGGITMDVLRAAVSRLKDKGLFTLRLYEEVQAPDLPALRAFLQYGTRTGDGDAYFKTGCIKLLTDGSLGARTAYLHQPYRGSTDNRGVRVYEDRELDEITEAAHDAGIQMALHAIGDGALEQCLNALKRAQKGNSSLRHRIVHCQMADDSQLDRMARLGLCADIQPPFTATDAPMVLPLLGADREARAYRWKTMLRLGIPLAGGSDSPVERMDPLWGIACAVTRQDAAGNPSGGWHPNEKLTVDEAVRLYTTGGAHLSFEENLKGRIAPGMLADFAVLDRDPYTSPPDTIKDIRVAETILGGETVYNKSAS